MQLQATALHSLRGDVRVPGDKSLSHRSLMLGGLSVGRTIVRGILDGDDIRATQGAMEALGARITVGGDGTRTIQGCGVGGFREPDRVLDMGNAGTGARLICGMLAGHDFTSFMTGDVSLCRRPMARIFEPLSMMGARFTSRQNGRLPVCIEGAFDPIPIEYRSKVASAQIKSAILLAGLHAPGWTSVVEPALSRDHSERMLQAFGARVETGDDDGMPAVRIQGEVELQPIEMTIPSDPSSAAFVIVAALIAADAEVRLSHVGMNPTRTGLIETLIEMGASIERLDERISGGEPVADLLVRSSALRGLDVPAARAPSMIDEYPILAIAAAFAQGQTRMRDLGELRVKESDRLTAMADGLAAAGVRVSVDGDDLIVDGGAPVPGGVLIDANHDHRIAMSFIVLGGGSQMPIRVDGAETINTSFPDFAGLMNGLGASIGPVEGA